MNAKTNGMQSAHPVHELLQDRAGDYTMRAEGGLTKREAFAMAAMQGIQSMLSHPDVIHALDEAAAARGMQTDQYIADNAVSLADALLVALSQEPQS